MADWMSKQEINACWTAERAAGFDRGLVERDLDEVMRSLGIGSGSGPSAVPGVAVYLCEDLADEESIRKGLERLGHAVADVTCTTWIVEDGTDEEVVAVAFDTPCLPAEWRGHAPAPKL
jgi:hypothetical protein